MTATLLPRVFAAGDEHVEATTCIDIDEVTGSFDQLESSGDALSAASLGVGHQEDARAA